MKNDKVKANRAKVVREGSYVLGLKLGCASLGWAAMTLDSEDKPISILAMGARKFPIGASGDVDSGREAGNNQRKRETRSVRVRLARRVQRLRELWTLLQGAGLLPPGKFKERDGILKSLDDALRQTPYELRVKAIGGPVTPYELGRAIYHLAQRRGFQPSRKDGAQKNEDDTKKSKKEEELGIVKKSISELQVAIATQGSRTLGEHLLKKSGKEPLRRRWTSRTMLRDELTQILDTQAPWHHSVTDSLKKKLHTVIFHQRPLKSQSHKIGKCDLEPSRKRCALANLDAQELRVLCRVNDLRLVDDVGAEEVELSLEQRTALLEILKSGDATFPAVRKALGIPKTVRFNAERIDDEKLLGLRTEAKLSKALGTTWDGLTQGERAALVEDLTTIEDDGALERRLVKRFTEEQAAALMHTTLEPGHSRLSHKAVCKLLPLLRSGVAYATARKEVYPKADTHKETATLPLVQSAYPHLSNPLVQRALSELRVVVTALTKKYGRPHSIRVSLMRELRLGKSIREKTWIKNRIRNKQRAAAAARILKDLGVQEPARFMVDKVLLADECGWVCPFTGKAISMKSLVGGEPQFETVHLIPLHTSLDDSFENRALCHVSKLSGLRSVEPTTMRQVEVEGRFEKMVGPTAKEKLRRIRLTPEEISKELSEGAIEGRFVDSCYASKLAVDYLSRLYPSSRQAVTAVRGAITGYVREGCGLHRVELPRGSHKYAALDAVSVALCGPGTVKRVSRAAKEATEAPSGRRRLNPEVMLPWPRLVEDVSKTLDNMVVSARVRKKVSGALHEDTFYRLEGEEKGKPVYSVRKHLWQLSPSDALCIVSSEIREVVGKRLSELRESDPRKAFAKTENLPTFRGAAVRRVRVERRDSLFSIGKGAQKRYVATDRNHHACVFLRKTRGDKEIADRVVVSQFEAQTRLSKKQEVIQAPEGAKAVPGLRTIALLETLDCTAMGKGLQTIRCVSKDPSIVLTRLDDARKLAEIGDEKLRMSVEQLRVKGARKVVVTALGEVRFDGT